MPILSLSFESGESTLNVRQFEIRDALSTPFAIEVRAGSTRPDVNIGSIVGRAASFCLASGIAHARGGERRWTGICSYLERVHAVPEGKGESAYVLRIVPKLWLLSQRRNYRIFQHLSVPDIAVALLSEWGVEHALRLTLAQYPKLEYRVQYGETDFDFLSRMLEEAGITYLFEEHDEKGSVLVMLDAPHSADSRGAIWYEDEPTQAAEKEFITSLRIAQGVVPGASTVRDYDFRRPSFPLLGAARVESAAEQRLEQYHYLPGAFLVEQQGGGDTPIADDKSVARHSVAFGEALARRLLIAQRVHKTRLTFQTNVVDLRPGTVFSIDNYPGGEVDGQRLLLAGISMEGTPGAEWKLEATALSTSVPYVPAATTPMPRMYGVQSAVVVGPPGQEIYTDEFGRVRVHFPWDREGREDDNSSCWVRVSHGSAGGSFGMVVLPRVGQEVLIGFIEGNPDQPIVVGRVFNATSPVPYPLPGNKTVSGLKGSSSPGGGGYNEMKFDDAAGGELFSLQAQKDMVTLVKNDDAKRVLGSLMSTVVGNQTHRTHGSQAHTTEGQHDTVVMLNQTLVVGGSKSNSISGSASTSVDGSCSIVVGGDQPTTVSGSRSAKVGGSDTTGVGATFHVGISPAPDAAATTWIKMEEKKIVLTTTEATVTIEGAKIKLEADTEINLDTKGNIVMSAKGNVDLTADGTVTIKGANVKVNGEIDLN